MTKKNKAQKEGYIKDELKIIRDKQEQQELLLKTESLTPVTTVDRELEKIYLRGGRVTTIKQEKDVISNVVGKYSPMFPNKKPFFSLIYKLNHWNDLDPNDFNKPPVCALWIKQFIYARFDKTVLPTLLKIENPILYGHVKKYKLFQFLNDEGLELMENYIDQAIDEMKKSKSWYDFELKYTAKYNLSVQLKMFPKEFSL
jgi:hypothetical protein